MSKRSAFFKLDLLILSSLQSMDRYGYDITQFIKEHTDQTYDIKVGIMYPILYKLNEEGYISSYEKMFNGRPRIYYHLENKGIEYLNELIDEFTLGTEIVENFLALKGL